MKKKEKNKNGTVNMSIAVGEEYWYNNLTDDDLAREEEKLARMKQARQAILSQYSIKQAGDGRWWCWIGHGRDGRKKIMKTRREDLENAIIEYHTHASMTVADIWNEITIPRMERARDAGNIAGNTIERYQYDFVRFFGTVADIPMKDLDAEDWARFCEEVQLDCEITKKKCFNNMKIVLNKLLLDAKKNGISNVNREDVRDLCEVRGADLDDPDPTAEHNIFTEEEVEKIRKWLLIHQGGLYRNLLLLLTVTGLRIGELAVLHVDSIDDISVHVKSTERHEGGDYYPHDSAKTKAGERRVFVPSDWQWLLPELKACANKDGWIAVGVDGERATTCALRNRWYLVVKAANVKKKSPHKMRKTVATMMRGRVDEEIVIEQLGHVNVDVTRDSYYYGMREKENERISALDKVPEFGGGGYTVGTV